MTNRDLQYIISEIKKKEGVTLQEIAAAIGKDRTYLSKLINIEEEKELTKTLVSDFEAVYPAYFQRSHKNHGTNHLPGTTTLQDHINLYERWLADREAKYHDAEAKYQDAKAEKATLIEVINNYLKAIPNLIQGQQDIKEQFLASGKALAALMEQHKAEILAAGQVPKKGIPTHRKIEKGNGKGTVR